MRPGVVLVVYSLSIMYGKGLYIVKAASWRYISKLQWA